MFFIQIQPFEKNVKMQKKVNTGNTAQEGESTAIKSIQ